MTLALSTIENSPFLTLFLPDKAQHQKATHFLYHLFAMFVIAAYFPLNFAELSLFSLSLFVIISHWNIFAT